MSEKIQENLAGGPEVIALKDVDPVAVNVPVSENPAPEIVSLKKEAAEVFEIDYMKALDISVAQRRFKEDLSLKNIEATFVLHGVHSESGQKRDEEFTVRYSQKEEGLFIEIMCGAFKMECSFWISRDQKRNMSIGNQEIIDMGDLEKYGFYGQLIEGLLQNVDVTQNSVSNKEVRGLAEQFGDHMPPSILASRSAVGAGRINAGFVAFYDISTTGIHFTALRVPDELHDILIKAKEWDRANYDDAKKAEFKDNHKDYNLLTEAKKIEDYLHEHRDELEHMYAFYPGDCVKLLELQVDRFKKMEQKIDEYPLVGKKKEKPKEPPVKKTWWWPF